MLESSTGEYVMRCLCCDRILSDYEATTRHAVTNEFIEICNQCLDGLNIPTRSRPDLNPFEDMDTFNGEDFLMLEDPDA